MKKKVLLSSILTIALCLCLIAGSTFALFTSTTKVDISVTAAKVKMEASISELTLYSVQATAGGSIVDEFGGQYKYVDRTAAQAFANGGTAVFEDATLKLDRITPGDKVSFNIEGANTSDVTIQYRYVVECLSGEKLMSGLLVTIGDTTYPILDSYTSVWNTLTPGSDITPVPVVIEFPVTAGNEYQELSTEIKVTVEAIQGNADTKGTTPTVEFLDGYTADLGGQTLDDYIKNVGTITLSNGTLVLENTGFENYGNATLNNIVIDGGKPGYVAYGYGIIGQSGSVTVLNDVSLKSANGGIGAVNGANVIFNDGYLEVDSLSTSARYLFYVAGEGSEATINGGEFYFNKTQNQKRAYAYVGAGCTLYINGGNFGTASTRSGYTAGLMGDGTIIITGGTFGFNPTQWVADGYKTTKVGSQWIVTPYNTAFTPEEVADLLADPNTPVVDLAADMALTIGDIANKTINANGKAVNIVFNGAIDNVTVKGIVETAGANSINLKEATGTLNIVDCELKSAASTSGAAILVGPAANVVIDNCTISSTEGKTYGIYNSGASGSLTITNSTFDGFSSWAIQVNNKVNGDVLVDNCTFTTPDGVLKVLSGVQGNYTFTNNTMIGCKGHDGKIAQLFSVSCTGTQTIYGNTLDGAEWPQA